ncbi:ferrous iron transport protein B [Desulfuromonas sp. CSMB_57]|uniref:ferrous iron transport protein B n=1 Tax=Desulfuromonas sp. CSMB_57 TaxID=2807629 RepID=UPI0020BDE107|nr:ferrous iron transport protein B [Desulfuromonas sp. CSMB_57]
MSTTIALAGNPNSGKTTLFNALTGARQHVGNYPGVTVERKEGSYVENGQTFKLIDLPGMYSLTAYSLEEVVARDFLVQERPAAIVNIIDASNLERNLYLTVQFMELGVPVCIALNMIDAAQKRGIEINGAKLSELMGVPVVPTVARSGQGKSELMQATGQLIMAGKKMPPLVISYGEDVDLALQEMEQEIVTGFSNCAYPPRWLALKILENDEQILDFCQKENPELYNRLEAIKARLARHISSTLDTCPEAVIADHRYGYIKAILKQGVISHNQDQDRLFISDRIDQVVTNRFAGPLIMLAVIMGLYHFTFTYSELPVAWLEGLFGWLSGVAEAGLPDGLLKSLIIAGVIDGAGGVLGFAPIIMFMFFGIAILEDSGYLARVAFMLDRVFRSFGLHGASVMPFIVSGGIAGGCAVPGVMATRTLKSPRERLATLLTAPFMNCGAKLPVFALLVGAFFAQNEARVMLIITLIAWCGALLSAKLLRSTVIRGESTPFVMELPPYRLPTFRGLLIHTWERTWQYVKKAGTIILAISILLWALMTFPGLPETRQEAFEQQRETVTAAAAEDMEEQLLRIDAQEAEAALRHSIAGQIGTAMESVTSLAGFDWRTNIALVGGFAAKEVVVSTLGTAYSLGEVDPEETGSLAATLAKDPNWNPVVAFALIVFTIFYAPCFVTVVCIAREAGSWKWGAFSIVFNTAIAFGLAVLVYQIGSRGIFGA